MKSFPIFLDVADKLIVIAGGGEEAAQKARLALKTEARLRVMAPELCDELRAAVDRGRAEHVAAVLDAAALRGARLVFIATECAGADAAIAAVARDAGAIVNVVDRPELCDATTPAIVDRDPVVVAIGTEGAAPVLARQIKSRVEAMLEPSLGSFAALAGRLRQAVAERVAPAARRAFWAWAFEGAPRQAFAKGDAAGGEALLCDAIAKGGAPEAVAGLVSLVGAGPGAADLITLRGVRRLQEADVIYYDRLVDPSIFELARRDAERVFVGKRPGFPTWPQARINNVIVAAARQGRRVVRLKCGDPLVFGRAAEERAACAAAGVACEVVPGVTSALAAAAAAEIFPTKRGETQAFTLATASGADGAAPADLPGAFGPGRTTALYMGAEAMGSVLAALRGLNAPATLEVAIVESAETPRRRVLRYSLGALLGAARVEPVAAPAIIFVTWPRDAAGAEACDAPTAHDASSALDTTTRKPTVALGSGWCP